MTTKKPAAPKHTTGRGMTESQFASVWAYTRAHFGPIRTEQILRPMRHFKEHTALRRVSAIVRAEGF